MHLGSSGMPLNRYLVEMTIPDDAWNARHELSIPAAPVGWDALPEGETSLNYGDGGCSAL